MSPRRTQTRERLLTAALSVFAEHGVGSATVEQVCEHAGFTRGAFYSNFESWNELYLALLRSECQRVGEAGNRLIAELQELVRAQPEADLVTPTVDAFVRSAGHDARHVLALMDLRQFAVRNPVLWPGLQEVDGQSRQVLRNLVDEILPVAGLRLRVDPDLLITAVIALYDAVGMACVTSGQDFRTAVTAALVELLQGLLVRD